MAKYHSTSSTEKQFGSFARAAISLPFVKVEDMSRAMKIIEKLSKNIVNKSCITFCKNMINYLNNQWINGHIDLKVWNMFNQKGHRTNNLCEGYNYKLGSKKSIPKHPNFYLSCSIIQYELHVTRDNAYIHV